MPDAKQCPQCGAKLSDDGPYGRCPACLMALAVGMGAHGTEVVDSDETPSPKTEGGSRTIRYFGDYELLEEIARGGMGVVYRARQVSLNRPVALKMILAGRLATPASMQRFQTEAESAARLDHPHIVPIYEIGEHDRQHYFSMKLIDGGTLAERIAKQPLTRPADTLSHPMGEGRGEGERSVPTFDVRHSAFVISKVARAVHYAHQRGILHRDLKPTNILIDGQGEPHVTDFGLAKLIESDAGLTHSAAVMGTPSYMAPEQAAGHVKELTTATDIYSLGAILYELLAAQPPFVAETPLEIMRKVVEEEPIPPSLVWRRHGEAAVSSKSHLAPRKSEIDKDLETICLKCLNKNPQSRYGSAEMLADDLCRWRNGEPILARPVSAAEKLWRWCKRKPTIAALLAAVLVLLVTVTAGSILAAYRLERSSKQAREAEQRAREKLWASYLDQARAARWSGRAGRRFKSLEAITKAAEIQPSLELRNEAIAALALVDIRVIKTRRNPDPKRELPAWDAAMERYAIATPGKDIVLRRASDDGELARLPDIGSAAACAYPFSPDGAWLPVLYSDGGLKLWNLARAEPLFSVPNILSTVSIDFHPDGRRVTVAQPSTNLPIYSLADGAELKSFPIPYLAHCVRFDPSGKRIAIAASNRREVVVLDADSGAVQLSLLHPAGVGEVAWHPSGERLATAGKDGLLRVWDAATGGLFRPPMNGNRGELANIAYTHRGGILLSSHWAGLLLWDAETGERLVELEAYLGTIGVSADDQRVGLITWGLSHLSLCELALGRAAQSIRLPGPNFIGDVAFSPDARWLACAVPEAVYLLNSESTALLVKLPATGAASVCFSPDGETLYVTEARGLFAWPIHANLASGEVVFGPARRLGSASPFRLVRSSPTGKTVAVVHDAHCHLINVDTGDEVKTDAVSGSHICSIAFSPDGRWLAAGGWGRYEVKIWAASDGQRVHTITNVASPRVCFSPNGQWLLVGDEDDSILCEAGSWTAIRRIPHDSLGVSGFCPATGTLAVRETKPTVRLLDPATGETLALLEPPGMEHVSELFFSPDGARLAATRRGAHDVLLWDIRAIRAELKRMKLDWAGPALPPAPAPQFRGTNFILETASQTVGPGRSP